MYDEKYYRKHEKGSYCSAIHILEYLQTFLSIHSIIDFGCGMGTWGRAALDLDMKINDFLGIDQHKYDESYMAIAQKNYMTYDLRKSFNINRKYDLAISVEVAEHIPSIYSDIFVKNICLHSDVILFSAALPFQGGSGHINEQTCSYWINKFKQNDYIAIDCVRPKFWDNENIEVWYKNNCLLFVKDHLYKKIYSDIPEVKYPADIIHPLMLKRILEKKGSVYG